MAVCRNAKQAVHCGKPVAGTSKPINGELDRFNRLRAIPAPGIEAVMEYDNASWPCLGNCALGYPCWTGLEYLQCMAEFAGHGLQRAAAKMPEYSRHTQ